MSIGRANIHQYALIVVNWEMQCLLRMVVDGEWISLSDIYLIIAYLTEKQDKMQLSLSDKEPSQMLVC